MQKSVDLTMMRKPFIRLVRREMESIQLAEPKGTPKVTRAQDSALRGLQEVFENYIVQMLDGANLLAIYVGHRKSVSPMEINAYSLLTQRQHFGPNQNTKELIQDAQKYGWDKTRG